MPKNECSPNLVLIIQYSSSDMVVQGLKRFQAKHDHYFQSIELFYVSDLENETISESEIAKPLQQADIVLVDVRSNRITSSYLEKYLGDREETDIIFLLGMGLGTLNHRLGGFDLAKLIARFKHKDKPAESGSAQEADEPDIERFHEEIPERGVDLAFIQRMKDMTIKFGKILPFGAIKKMRHIMEMVSWWESGKIENFVCILELLASKYYDLHISRRQRQKPVESYDAAFWFPELGDLEIPISELLKRIRLDQDKRTIFVLFYGGYHFAHSSILIRELFEKYSSEWNIIPFYTDGISTTKYLNDFIDIDAPFDAVLSVLWFPLNGGPGGGRLEYTHKLFENWNVPVFNGIGLYNQLKEDYLETEEGLSPITTLASVIFPEMDGFSDSLPLIGTEEVDITLSNAAHRVVQPCLFRRNVELMMKRIDKRVHLQK